MTCFPKLFSLLAAGLLVTAPGLATAQDCIAQVRALWAEGGPLDPYQRPPHRHVNTVRDATGAVTRVFTSIIETPLRTVAGIPGTHMTLAIDNEVWTGPGETGPWTAQPGFDHDRRAAHLADQAQRQANLEDVACHGTVERDGSAYLSYGYTTRTDPNEEMGGAWYGSTDTVFIDPETGQVMIWEMGEFRSSWAPEPDGETHEIVYEYDPALRVVRPE